MVGGPTTPLKESLKLHSLARPYWFTGRHFIKYLFGIPELDKMDCNLILLQIGICVGRGNKPITFADFRGKRHFSVYLGVVGRWLPRMTINFVVCHHNERVRVCFWGYWLSSNSPWWLAGWFVIGYKRQAGRGSDNSNNERDYKIRSLSAIFRVIDLQFALHGNM